MKEVKVILHWMDNEDSQEQKTLTIDVPNSIKWGYPSLIRYEGHYYIFSPFNFGFEPIYYFRVRSLLDLDKVKDESLEEVLSKE